MDLCAAALRDELIKHPAISLASTEFVAAERHGLAGCSIAALQDVCDRHPEAAAIVFFCGLPTWVDVSGWLAQHATPKLIVVDLNSAQAKLRYGGYFAHGILAAFISSRRDWDPARPVAEPQTPRDWFNQRYQVYSSQNYESLPE